MNKDSESPSFWDDRYKVGKTPWDFHGVPARLRVFLNEARGSRVFIPGCGSGHEIAAFLEAGCSVTALDFSEAAVALACALPGNEEALILQDDFFTCPLRRESFDIVYERTFLCALNPSRWREYVDRMQHLLRPGGLLSGFFFYGEEPEPPPYPLTIPMACSLFDNSFRQIRDEPVRDSLPLFRGRERWQEWSKLSAIDILA